MALPNQLRIIQKSLAAKLRAPPPTVISTEGRNLLFVGKRQQQISPFGRNDKFFESLQTPARVRITGRKWLAESVKSTRWLKSEHRPPDFSFVFRPMLRENGIVHYQKAQNLTVAPHNVA